MEQAVAVRAVPADRWTALASTAVALRRWPSTTYSARNATMATPFSSIRQRSQSWPHSRLQRAHCCFVASCRRQKSRGQSRAGTVGLICSVLSVVPGVAFLWLGFPFVVAGAGIALGLFGLNGPRRLLSIAAIALGALVIALGSVYYAAGAVGALT